MYDDILGYLHECWPPHFWSRFWSMSWQTSHTVPPPLFFVFFPPSSPLGYLRVGPSLVNINESVPVHSPLFLFFTKAQYRRDFQNEPISHSHKPYSHRTSPPRKPRFFQPHRIMVDNTDMTQNSWNFYTKCPPNDLGHRFKFTTSTLRSSHCFFPCLLFCFQNNTMERPHRLGRSFWFFSLGFFQQIFQQIRLVETQLSVDDPPVHYSFLSIMNTEIPLTPNLESKLKNPSGIKRPEITPQFWHRRSQIHITPPLDTFGFWKKKMPSLDAWCTFYKPQNTERQTSIRLIFNFDNVDTLLLPICLPSRQYYYSADLPWGSVQPYFSFHPLFVPPSPSHFLFKTTQ